MFQFPHFARANTRQDLLSGLTVALALVPEAVAFAFVAGVSPMVGLHAAFMMGLIAALFGGRPGMISGATGAMAVVAVALVAEHGVEYLFLAVLLAGLLQLTAGLLKLGKFIRLVPYPVMIGFVNGLALVIFLAQLGQFKVPDASGQLHWLGGPELYLMLGLVALTMLIIWGLPKLTTAIPASLVAILTITLLVQGLGLETRTVIDFVRGMTGETGASLAGSLPAFHLPDVPWNLETLQIVLPYAVILASVGLIESLLTLNLIDEMTQTRGNGNRECLGQGLANMTNGLFGGMGGCAMIGQSMINIESGGRGRLSGISAAVLLMGFVLFGAPLIEQIPLAALVGVMFMVVLGTFEWASFKMMGKVPKQDAFVILLVTLVTLLTDLALAVFTGVIVSALVFAWQNARQIRAERRSEGETLVYRLNGPLFFASSRRFGELFSPQQDPQRVILDFADSRVCDHSAIEAIDSLVERYQQAGKRLQLRHLSPDCRRLLRRAGNLVEVDLAEDPQYAVISELQD